MDEVYTGSTVVDSQGDAANGGRGSSKDKTEALFADLLKDENDGLAVKFMFLLRCPRLSSISLNDNAWHYTVTPYITWLNYTLVNFSGIWGPVLAGWMCSTKLGRKYTMVIGALITMAFFFAYTQVRTATQNVAFTCIINFCLNIYYGTLYAYTPEVLPSAHRGTGNGIAIGWNRVMGILSAVIATVADVSCSFS